MSNTTLTKEELAALDLMIEVLRNNPDLRAQFIGDIFNVTKKIIDVTVKVTPVVTPFVAGAQASGDTGLQQLKAAGFGGTGGLSLDQLLELRKAATGSS